MKTGKRLFAMLLVMLMLLSCVPLNGDFLVQAAQEEKPEVFEYRPDEAEEPWSIPEGYVFTGRTNYYDDNCKIFELVRQEGTGGLEDIMWIRADGSEVPNPDIAEYIPNNKGNPGEVRASIPKSYDARDYGYVMPVEDQVGGTCWAHATISCMETNFIKKGYAKSIDLSEYHLTWNALNGYVDGNTSSINDGLKSKTEENVYAGGSPFYSSNVLFSFSGAVKESRFNLDTSSEANLLKSMKKTFNLENRYMYDAVLTDIEYILYSKIENVKSAVMELGSVYLSFAAAPNTYTGKGGVETSAGEIICAYSPVEYTTDHAVTIVGWDDNFSKNNFGKYKPKNNGAWLIKNSWGTGWGNDGYFWLSYEDKTIGTVCYAFETSRPEDFENVYMYNGYTYGDVKKNACGGNVFRSEGSQKITKISYGGMSDFDYTLKIYKNLPENYSNPTQGTLAYTQKGNTAFNTFIDLNNPVSISKGELFSVVLEMDSIYVEGKDYSKPDEYVRLNSASRESYYYTSGTGWVDSSLMGDNNVCIKAITKTYDNQPPYSITFRDPGYYEMTYTTNTSSISLPSVQGYTYVFTYNGQPFTGTGIDSDMIVEMHCYPTNGKQTSECTIEYKCYYCKKTMKAAKENHVFKTTTVSATETSLGYTHKKCYTCDEESFESYKFYPGANWGMNFQGNSPMVWQYYKNNLSVLCMGDTPDFTAASSQPWSEYNSLIKKVTVGRGTTRIGDYLFAGMNKLTSVSLPSSVTEIGEYCFYGASALKTFTCPSNLTVIENCAFKDATSLVTINYNKKLTKLGSDVFAACRSMKVGVVPGTLVGPDAIGWAIFGDCESLEKIVIEEGVTHFDKIMYWGGGKLALEEIVIPSTLVSFVPYNFIGLKKYTVSPYNRYYTDVDGVLYNKNLTTLVSYPGYREVSFYNIPDSVNEIAESAFYCTWYLRYLDMSCAVTTLEKSAFWCAYNIKINLPSGLKKICTEAFDLVSSPAFYIPSSVTTIEPNAFITGEGYYINAFYTNSSSAAIKAYASNNGYKCYTTHTGHSYSTNINEIATRENDGISLKECACSRFKCSSFTPRVATLKLSSYEVTYNGKKRTPSVIVKDSRGIDLVKGTDYIVDYTYASGRKLPGEYTITVKFMGKYYGTWYLLFTILPKAPTTISASQSTSVINLKWSASTGATGYRVYQYSPSKGKYVQIASVKGVTSYRKDKNLKAGTQYSFKIKPYTKLSDGTVLWGTASSAFLTATECVAPSIVYVSSPSKSKATVEWTDVSGETGYQLYYSTSKNGTYKKVKSYGENVDIASKTFSSSASGKTIYFKARAYSKVNGQTIFSQWSSVKSVKLK